MDLLENFILFDHSGGKTVKIPARNHQYLGVNEAVESYKARKLKDGKLGVFWLTQGSGKSYSMVFFAQKVRRKFAGSPTFVILTDRDELDKQISDTFEACGCLSAKASTYIPSSGNKLREKLKGNPSYIFTLIQKFNDDTEAPITPDHDIIILSDEAHRSQNGIFADNMVRLLPTASRLGFTGTPLFKYDNITERTFGSYVSIYDFKRAVYDGATVPLYYENRSDMLDITNPEINDELLNAIEEADLDVNEQAKLELELSKDIHIITSEPRLDTIAKDFVEHYSELWTTGKAMFVCVNKVTCVRMYNLAQKYWNLKIKELEKQLLTASQQEVQELNRKITWMKETEMAVVVSQEQNEISTFRNWGLDIEPHRAKMEKRELDKKFKDSDSPFRVVFVCAMWLTGFDVKSLATIYLDKPLKAHTLMQTIARANRVCDGKSNGLIVDYIDFDRLRKEFEKAQNKNLMFKDLQDIVEERLLRMMKNNPLRINYYERYQEIVDEYNKENRKDEIAIVFENLINLVNDLDEVQKRYVREGFESDEELTMFDLLVKDSLTKEETKQVKKLAQTMLAKIKNRIHELDHWRDKEETQSIISVMIRDLLWAELPESYDDVAIADYRHQIYEYVYNAYPAA